MLTEDEILKARINNMRTTLDSLIESTDESSLVKEGLIKLSMELDELIVHYVKRRK